MASTRDRLNEVWGASGWKRLQYEAIVVALLGAGFAIAFLVTTRGSERRHEEEVGALKQRCEEELAGLRASGESWTRALVEGDARALCQTFAAGIHAAISAGRFEAIDTAIGQVVLVPGVVFVHVLSADGAVLGSSDRKLSSTGRAGERAAWALGVGELSIRKGDLPGTTEAALPIPGPAAPAFVWMGYGTDAVLAGARPRGRS